MFHSGGSAFLVKVCETRRGWLDGVGREELPSLREIEAGHGRDQREATGLRS